MTSRPVPNHRATTRRARGDAAPAPLTHDANDLEGVSRDSAQMVGQAAALTRPTSEAQIAALLRSGTRVLPIGTQSSVTGGATPQGDTVLSLSRFDHLELTGDTLRVGAGVPLQVMQEYLQGHRRAYPAAPTYTGATIGGAAANNAAGAATFKYGTTRDWVEGLTIVLASGDVLDLQRGQVTAHPDGYFDIEGPEGTRRVPVPGYTMPGVVKLAAGYYAAPGMDLIDLFIGAEGTLGVITEVRLRTTPAPATAIAFIPLADEATALRLVSALRGAAQRAWTTGSGLDVNAVESIDGRCLQILREDGHTRYVPRHAGYALLVQIELPPAGNAERYAELERAFDADAPRTPLTQLCQLLLEHDAFDDAQIALPGEPFAAELLRLREAVPEGVNRRVREAQRGDERISKSAGDMIVPFEHFPHILRTYREGFESRGLEYAIWGHASDGNLHPNLLPRSYTDVQAAREALFDFAREVIRLGGSPLSEHGVGKSPLKQAFLRELYGDAGLAQMRAVKAALDPLGQLAPGNLFPPG